MQLDRAWQVMSGVPNPMERLAPILAAVRRGLALGGVAESIIRAYLCSEIQERRPDFSESNALEVADAILVLASNERSTLS